MTSAIALLLILIGGFLWIVTGVAIQRFNDNDGWSVTKRNEAERIGLVGFALGLFLLLAGWWLA